MVLVAVAVCAGIVRESAEQVAEARVNLHDCRRLLHERRAARTQRANVVAALSGGRTIEFDSHRRLPVACSARPKRVRERESVMDVLVAPDHTRERLAKVEPALNRFRSVVIGFNLRQIGSGLCLLAVARAQQVRAHLLLRLKRLRLRLRS